MRYIRNLEYTIGSGFLTLTLIVAGCAPNVRYEYVKAGVTQEQGQGDERECESQSTTVRRGRYGGQESQVDWDGFNRCMGDRGYEVRVIPASEGKVQAPTGAAGY